MSAVIQLAMNFHQITCGICKQPFAVIESKYNRCKDRGESFFCPDGHSLVFTETEKQRLEKELEKEKKRREWAEINAKDNYVMFKVEERRSRALKGVNTKIKNRIGNGVCPCCSRTFQNLQNHMKSKHPDFKKAEE